MLILKLKDINHYDDSNCLIELTELKAKLLYEAFLAISLAEDDLIKENILKNINIEEEVTIPGNKIEIKSDSISNILYLNNKLVTSLDIF